MSFTAIKSSLNQFCKNNQLKNILNEITLNVNKITKEAYMFANLHILSLLNQGKNVPSLNQTFFRNCLSCVSKIYDRKEAVQNNPEFIETLNNYKLLIPQGYQIGFRDNIPHILEYVAQDMVVATANHLELNFYKRFTQFLKSKYPETTNSYRYEVYKDICNEKYDGNDTVVLEFRKKLGNEPPYRKFFEKDPTNILKAYNEILTFNLQNDKRTFSLLPHKNGFQMSYITIDKSALKDIITSERLIEMKDGRKKDERGLNLPTILEIRKDIMNDPHKYWNLFFNIKRSKTEKRELRYFQTDGKTVSITFERFNKEPMKKKKSKKKTLKKDIKECPYDRKDFQNIIGLDPGLRYPFVGYDNHGDLLKYSSKQYYHEAGFNRVKKKQDKCYFKNPEWLSYMANMPSPKTNDISKLSEYIKYVLQGLDNALAVHYKNPFRKWKFTSYIGKKKVFNKICKKITKKAHKNDKNVTSLIGFGNWSNPSDSIIKGHKRGPVKELKEELKRWCPVIDIDEFRTSKLCNKCYHETSKVMFNGKQINSVLRCNNNECGITIDRDVNGAKNIYMVFNKWLDGEERPKEYCRTTK